MRKEYSLLERLDNERLPTAYSTQFDWQALLQSVTRNIQDMLNVRVGSVQALPQFGMPDFNDVVNQFPDAAITIQNAIQRFIQDYEPRLESVIVQYDPDPDRPLLLRYFIEGRLKHHGQLSRVSFDTVLTGSGQATVQV
ncbi:MAG: type VI secretion system baseplate subunit TssE [Pseudomonadota bacterium]|nr:type VI secretion system baseplate subunit TssE [Pseudomonadales bacterium]MDY6920086.1 type VI secretion system baseplate subunit TssE [Pseudomonadota bacterium]